MKVLLVDDEPYVLEGLKVMIDWAALGFSILLEASNGEDALEIVKLSNPDLIITDIKMPVMDGLEFIRLCVERLRSTAKFIILSGYDDFSYATRAMHYNVSDYLLKPLDSDELNKLASSMAARVIEERKKADNANNQFSFIANQCIRRIIKGEMKASLINRIGMLLGMDAEERAKCLLIELGPVVRKKTVPGVDPDSKKASPARQVIEDKLGAQYMLHLFEDDMGRFGIIACETMPFYNSIENFAREMLEALETETGLSPTIAVSLSEKGPYSFSAIYKQALYALNYRFFYGDGKVIEYKDVRNLNLNNELCTRDFNSLLESVRSGQNDDTEEIISQFFVDFSENLRAPGSIIAYVKCFDLELIRLIMEMGGEPDGFSNTSLELWKLMERLTISGLKDAFLEHCRFASEYINRIRQSNPQSVINEVKNYIKQNYSKNIKLKNVAKVFYMNPVYLGQIFRKSTGMQFNDYLNLMRIEEAKKLLRRTDLKIQEIARAVGFNDSKYFFSKFKSITSLPPSAYKDMD